MAVLIAHTAAGKVTGERARAAARVDHPSLPRLSSPEPTRSPFAVPSPTSTTTATSRPTASHASDGWVTVVDDRFDAPGRPPAHWREYDGPYGSDPHNCARPSHNYVADGSMQQASRGKGAALRAGFQAATSDFVVMIDADGSMDPGEIHRYVTPLINGYDLVKGSRFLDGGGSTDLTKIRWIGSKAFVRMTNALFLVRFTDLCYGFCSFRRDCLDALALTAHGFEIETEIAVHAAKADLRIAEVPSMERERRTGVSKLHAVRDGQRVLRTLVRERLSRRSRPVIDPINARALDDWQSALDSR
jgi:hypothetical protein